MARLIRAGEFATDGERKAAEVLHGLPETWVVIANKVLVTRDARSYEIDFLVLVTISSLRLMRSRGAGGFMAVTRSGCGLMAHPSAAH